MPTCEVDQRGSVLVVTINRPQVRNAIDAVTGLAIAEALDRLDADPTVRVGVLTGAGGYFCSGMDLRAFAATGERPEVPGRGLAGLTEAPPRKPLLAAVEGPALAGGCEMALACDLVVAGASATFGLPEVKRGLIAGSGGLLRLAERIPQAVAMEYSLTGRSMPAAEAHRWGLVNRLTDDGGALDAALQLAGEITENSPTAVRISKRVIVEAPRWSPDSVWASMHDALDEVLAGPDAREGAEAFLERRPPVWSD